MLLEIRSNTGEVKIVAAPSDNDRETAGIQQDSALSLSFTAFECVALDVYDYVDFLGRRYILTEAYMPQMNARGEWAYSVKFSGVEALAAQTLMVNPTDGTDNPVVTLTAPAAEHAALIVANLNRRTGSSDWQVGEVIETPYLDIDYTGKNAAEAVAALAEAAGTEWWFDAMTLNICRCEFGEPIELEYGGILLGGIKRGVADGADFFTRLFPIGSSRNIDVDKYGHARLQLPDGSAYVDSRTELGIIERFEEDAFAGIYPRRIGTVGAVRSETRTGDDGVDYTVWFFTDPDLPFNPNDYEIGGLVKNVTFQTGELRGRVFEVNYDTRSGEFEIITQWPYDNGVQLPTPPMIPASGDEYILWNISMPESYYPAAEQEYAEAVAAFIADRQKDVSVFTAPTDYTVATPVAGQLRPGRRVRIKSEEYFPETGWHETRIISVSRSVANVGSMTLTMSDVLSSGRIQAIESGLNEVRGATSKISSSLSSKNESLARKLDKSAFYDLFEKINIGSAESPLYAIRAKYGLYTDSFLSALGLNPGTGSGGGGATALYELSDVQLAGLLTGDVLIYDGTHWVNRPQSSIVPNLSEYATRVWVQQQGYATSAALAAHAGDATIHISSAERTLWNRTAADFAAIVGADSDQIINKWEEVVAFLDTYTEADTLANLLSNKVDKVAGYGLSKNDFTDALLSKLNGIDAGANRYVHPTGGADASIDDAAGRVLAGITVNALGHVTSVASKTLAAADIPTLAISKVSGLQDALDGKLDAATFDDLFEKVNIGTTSAPKYAIRAKYGLYADGFLSALGLNSSGGGGEGGGSYDRLDAWSDYTSERAGWVLSAALGYDLHSRVRSLEGGSALSFTTEGSGNVVTAVKKSGTAVIVTKGLTALTSHQPIYALNFQAGAFEAKKYTPNTGVATVNVPTKVSHLSNDSGFLTAAALTPYITAATAEATFATKLGISGNQIGTYVNGKLGNLITVPYATNANALDGSVETEFFRRRGRLESSDLETFAVRYNGAYYVMRSGYADGYLVFQNGGSSSCLELLYNYKGTIDARFSADNNRYSTGWKSIAFTDSNVASATKLQTARTLWGQPFDGTGNVSGNMTGVGSIGATGNITISRNPARFIAINGDATISLNNSTYKGVYYDTLLKWLIASDGTNTFLEIGNVAIGKKTAEYPLDVAGAIRVQNRLYFGDSAHYIEVDNNGYFHFSHGVYSDGFLSAKGLNSSGGGGEGGGSYDRLDAWDEYTPERAGWVLSAGLGYDLHSRVRSLEGGSALSFTTEGSGNVVTAVKKSGTAVIVTKGLTALTSHQPIYALNFQAGAFEAKKYTPNTGVATVNVPTKVSHLSNDSGFLTAAALTPYITAATAEATFATKLGISGNQIGTYVNGKLGNLITVPYATNANALDGSVETEFFRRRGRLESSDLETFAVRYNGAYYVMRSGYADGYLVFQNGGSSSCLELLYNYKGTIDARFSADNNRYSTGWKSIAFTDSNVASATKLQTARTLWGQPFDGSGDVSGDMTGVGSIDASNFIRAKSAYYLNNSDNTYRLTATISGNASIARLYMIKDADSTYGDLYLGHSSGTAICIKGGTNVGIGTASPAYKLDVAGISRFSSGLIVPYTGGAWINMATRTNLIRSETNNSASQAHALYRVKDSGGNAVVFGGLGGNVGFYGFSAANISAGTNLRSWWTTWDGSTGILTHNKDLEVLGTIHSATGIYSDGYVSAKGQNTASDARLKRRMEDVTLTVRDVAEAPVYRFAWINGGIDVGSTAQYWGAKVPELTHSLPDGIHLGLDYGKAALLSVVSVARSTADLERRITSLERQLQNRTI